jgi:hypothetical protein
LETNVMAQVQTKAGVKVAAKMAVAKGTLKSKAKMTATVVVVGCAPTPTPCPVKTPYHLAHLAHLQSRS